MQGLVSLLLEQRVRIAGIVYTDELEDDKLAFMAAVSGANEPAVFPCRGRRALNGLEGVCLVSVHECVRCVFAFGKRCRRRAFKSLKTSWRVQHVSHDSRDIGKNVCLSANRNRSATVRSSGTQPRRYPHPISRPHHRWHRDPLRGVSIPLSARHRETPSPFRRRSWGPPSSCNTTRTQL